MVLGQHDASYGDTLTCLSAITDYPSPLKSVKTIPHIFIFYDVGFFFAQARY